MNSKQNILTPLMHFASQTPRAIAFVAPDLDAITYSQLANSVGKIVNRLLRTGLRNKSRVALIAKDGPEMATLFLAVAGTMTCAPLNPKYTYEEFKFYLSDLQADSVILDDDSYPAVRAAKDLGIHVMRLSELFNATTADSNSSFDDKELSPHLAHYAENALILHTSGTTAKPKIVPLTHRNISASVIHIIDSLMLTRSDRCLNAMPMFHIHGLIITLLSSLAVGGSIVCSRGFIPEQFYNSIERFSPSWYTAVPTIHQAIVAHGRITEFNTNRSTFRLIRSSSSALSPQLARDLEQLFHVPVLAAYGMSETGQITINPLPPGERKSGSSGRATGCEVAVMDPNGGFVSPGVAGEIVVRGNSVIGGYENNSEANVNSFHEDWLRTGDQGYLDEEGYLFINGRIKELINRGGEKIMPREVEEAILGHSSVEEAAAFASPHPTLGEEVAVIIVTKPGVKVSEKELRRHAAVRLAEFKVPSKIFFANDIPKGPTGKIQRAFLAKSLGLDAAPPRREGNAVMGGSASASPWIRPRNEIEAKLEQIWSKLLNVHPISVRDSFFELGGNSLLTMQLVVEIGKAFMTSLPASVVFERNTIEQLASYIYSSRLAHTSTMVSIQPNGAKPPLFCIHDLSGDVIPYWNLASELGVDQPVFGLRFSADSDASHVTIEQLASGYIQEIGKIQPQGPYFLLGYSLGGMIAYEMAMQLRERSQEVSLLAMIDSRNPKRYPHSKNSFIITIVKNTEMIIKTPMGKKLPIIRRKLRNILIKMKLLSANSSENAERRALNFIKASNSYKPKPYPGRFVFFRAIEDMINQKSEENYGWESLEEDGVQVYKVPGIHSTIVDKPSMKMVAGYLGALL
ncbi:acyl-CoA synthetase [Cohnella endophytica]|uniref:Acyl-CoA synthetase n=1 Tax=Cohnella endophytica TaxID=2419778 RepID=A0A494XU47_9BACL|nr:AMP-binding protein [Cohnella endophytica]RKP53201.1 acyl-CoA synthetase [Cohnella endophytica]